jgi:thymidylate synthase
MESTNQLPPEGTDRSVQEEQQYLDVVKRIIETGEERSDRTGVGTRALFGERLQFDLSGGKMPLLTTKKMWWKGVVEELLWFISGSTDERVLASKGVHIWKANDRSGVGDLGPIYSHQFRYSGAEYVDHHTSYEGLGVDQLAWVINEIKTNPISRRLVVSAWNPKDLSKMALPPCHAMFQFFVGGKDLDQLSCQMYQRSADFGLGVPFNIASYALLTHLVASVCGMQANTLTICFGDSHVYMNHIDALQSQLTRQPFAFPTVKITEGRDLFSITSEDIELCGYSSHGAIKLEMAV